MLSLIFGFAQNDESDELLMGYWISGLTPRRIYPFANEVLIFDTFLSQANMLYITL